MPIETNLVDVFVLENLLNLDHQGQDKLPVAPKESWRPHLEIDSDAGGYFVSVPKPVDYQPQAAELLAEFDLKPEDWLIISIRRSKWQVHSGEWLQSFRVNLKPAGFKPHLIDIEKIEKEIKNWRPAKSQKKITGDLTALFAVGDTQWGKDAGDGTEGTVRRIRNSITESVFRFRELKPRGIGQIAIPQLGDCIEGVVSQGGKIAGRLDIPLTAQIRVGRRILLEWIKAFAPLTDSLIIPVVPGNHDESHRQLITDPMDSWQVEIVQQVLDICKENPDLSHIEGRFAESDNSTLAVKLSGVLVGFAHGHQARDIPKWWSGQAMGRTPVGQAEILITAHFHHFVAQQVGSNLWVQIPSMDGGSPWFRDRRGLESPKGIVSMVIGDGHDPRRDLAVLGGLDD